MAAIAVSIEPWPVIITICGAASNAVARRSTSMPSMPGSRMSISTTL